MAIYGESYKSARKERMLFAGGLCEVCKHDGSVYGLECHHPQPSYELDEQGKLTMQDVVILCVSCHDAITNRDRAERFALREYKVDVFECFHHFKRERKDESSDKINWNVPPCDAQQPNGRPAGRLRSGNQEIDRQTKED